MGDLTSMISDSVQRNQTKSIDAAGASIRGKAGQQVARFEANQIFENAKAIEALGIRESNDVRLRGDIMISNAKAAMAAGGGSTKDASAIELEAGILKNRDYNAAAKVYESKVQANATKSAGIGRWIEGDIMQREGRMGANMMFTAV